MMMNDVSLKPTSFNAWLRCLFPISLHLARTLYLPLSLSLSLALSISLCLCLALTFFLSEIQWDLLASLSLAFCCSHIDYSIWDHFILLSCLNLFHLCIASFCRSVCPSKLLELCCKSGGQINQNHSFFMHSSFYLLSLYHFISYCLKCYMYCLDWFSGS